MGNPEDAINPLRDEGQWYDTDEELVEALSAEIKRIDLRKKYLEEVIEEVVNRHG